MTTKMTNLDLLGILIEHEAFHQQLADGKFTEEGSYDDALAEAQLLPLVNALGGPQGVAKLLHIVHEMVVEVVGQKHQEFPDTDAQTYLTQRILSFMDWVGMALFSGALVGSGLPAQELREVPLDELDAQDHEDEDPA